MTDNELLEVYMIGFNEELEGKENMRFYLSDHKLKSKAYYLGRSHAFLGDEQTKFDYLSNEEITKIIRNDA